MIYYINEQSIKEQFKFKGINIEINYKNFDKEIFKKDFNKVKSVYDKYYKSRIVDVQVKNSEISKDETIKNIKLYSVSYKREYIKSRYSPDNKDGLYSIFTFEYDSIISKDGSSNPIAMEITIGEKIKVSDYNI